MEKSSSKREFVNGLIMVSVGLGGILAMRLFPGGLGSAGKALLEMAKFPLFGIAVCGLVFVIKALYFGGTK
ncbi:hypothetical protein ES703_113151 [subsurface metagenome]